MDRKLTIMNIGMLVYILFCHIIGDYFLQNSWMAYNKHRFTPKGFCAATVHCLVYTMAFFVILFYDHKFSDLTIGHLYFICIIFFSHFVIDKFPLVYWFVTKILRRKLVNATLQEIIVNTFVYIVIDNMLHVMLIYFILDFL